MRSDREQALEAEISRIPALGLNEIRTLWHSTFHTPPPPPFTKDLIARFICWHVQEQGLGGLDHKATKLLEGLARGVTVVSDGYVWRDTTYASLSTIARSITGTAWSGPRFFGVRAVGSRPVRGEHSKGPGDAGS